RGLVFRRIGRLRFLSAGRVWRNPLLWKDFHFLAGGWSTAIVKLGVYGLISLVIAGFYVFDAGPLARVAPLLDDIGLSIFFAMLVAAMIELSVLASRLFHDEWKWKTLDALLLLPRPIGR